MVQNLPPDNKEDQRQWIVQTILKHDADIQRLWKRMPTHPQSFIGVDPGGEDLTGTTTTEP